MLNDMAKKKLYLVCVCRDSESSFSNISVYCLAVSSLHAKSLARRFCIEELYWNSDSFIVFDPILLTHFVS